MLFDFSKRIVAAIPSVPHACPYLAGLTAQNEDYLCFNYDDEFFCRAIENGFRHFGFFFFRPATGGAAGQVCCGRCVPSRIAVERFKTNKNQRRVLNRARGISVTMQAPTYAPEKFALYVKHKTRFPSNEGSEAGSKAVDPEKVFV